MHPDRRRVLASLLGAIPAAAQTAPAPAGKKLGIPGPYPGKVVAVSHPASLVSNAYQAEPVKQMIARGMTELTQAESPEEAWRLFFQPGDVVGIKLNPIGYPYVYSAPEVLHPILRGLEQAGVRRRDIIVYDRYRKMFLDAGYDKWLPEGVRWMAASEQFQIFQMDMEGYTPDLYRELPLVHPEYLGDFRPEDPHIRRSYIAKFLAQEINKLINVCVLKHHQAAGVTLALKNLSHGLVNNVSRTHPTLTANFVGLFIPAVVDLPIFRQKVVLHILDGIKGAYHGGPGEKVGKYVWPHKTIYFATDPVALDKTGWKEVDRKRAEMGRAPVASQNPDEDSERLNCQVEHIELAGSLGLGVYDDARIRVRRVELS